MSDTVESKQEPAFIVGLIEAALVLLLSVQAFDLTAEMVAAIMAVVVTGLGFYTAYVTRETLLGVGVGLAKAVIALLAAFRLDLSVETTAALIGLVTVLLGGYQRTQAHPLRKGQYSLAA